MAAAAMATALVLASCTHASVTPASFSTEHLDAPGTAVVQVWYDNASKRERKKIRRMTGREISAKAASFRRLCSVPAAERARQLATHPDKIDASGAHKVADAIGRHMCPKPSTSPTPSPSKRHTPSPQPTGPGQNASDTPAAPGHDAKHDQAAKDTGAREPSRPRADLSKKQPALTAPKAPAPAAPAPAPLAKTTSKR